MLSPRLTNCVDCNKIPNLLGSIDCKLKELANKQYNNIVYALNYNIDFDTMYSLLNYKRILKYKFCNTDYAYKYTIDQIANRVRLITYGVDCKCDCDFTDTPPQTTLAPVEKSSFLRMTAVGLGLPNPPVFDGGTGNYYSMERYYTQSIIYQFGITNLIINGVNYGNGQSLTINALGDLVVGIGIYGGTYVQNINDWLNSIIADKNTEITFYDDMSTIDVPNISTSFDIEINSFNEDQGHYQYKYVKEANGGTYFCFKTEGEYYCDFGINRKYEYIFK